MARGGGGMGDKAPLALKKGKLLCLHANTPTLESTFSKDDFGRIFDNLHP